ncbi:MAG: hypothetical protein GVY15_01760 [Bacteroidetes bacterium]|jgi:uncharacterized protein involved in high-affinity Fe2+ transport|nr:hypothetical protein [Bacteroidota bacterium]
MHLIPHLPGTGSPGNCPSGAFKVLAALLSAFSLVLAGAPAQAQEMVIGEDVIAPGIHLVFEAAPKDDVTPYDQNLAEEKTDIHLEVLATWAEAPSVAVPEGVVRGGFVGYLHFFATVTNEATGAAQTLALIPHITLGDAMHYARNVSLPGETTDSYTVTFDVRPPDETELAFHKSWRDAHGAPLVEAQSFTFEGLDFEKMAAATRR